MAKVSGNSIQLGDSATATQNFVLQTNVDGTAKLSRGNVGATTQDVLTVDAAGKVTLLDATLALQDGLPTYACRAWCNLNGLLTGTNAPSAGGNVASVTRNSAGYYTVNFTTAMPDTNYAVSYGWSDSSTSIAYVSMGNSTVPMVKTTTQFSIVCRAGANVAEDISDLSIMVFR